MDKETKTIEGKLEHIEHIWSNSKFKNSDLHIGFEDGGRTNYKFYGLVPESMIGENIIVYQNQDKRTFMQRATFPNKNYQVQCWTDDFRLD